MNIPFFTKKHQVVKTTSFPEGWRPLIDANAVFQRDSLFKLYHENSDLSAVINFVSTLGSQLINSCEHYRGENEVKNSEILKLIQNPNEWDSGQNFWKQAIINYLLNGNCYLNPLKPVGFKKVRKIYQLNAHKVYIVTNGSTDEFGTLAPNTNTRNLEILRYNELLDSAFLPYQTEEIWQIKDASIKSELYGTSRIASAFKNIMISDAINDTIQTISSQGGALGFIKKNSRAGEISHAFDPEEKKKVEDNFYKYGSGSGKKPIFFTPYDLQYVRILTAISEFLPTELSALELRKICMAVGGVPEAIFNSTETTFTNLDKADKMTYVNVVIPIVEQFLSVLTKELLPVNERLKICIDDIEALQTNKSQELDNELKQVQVWQQMITAGIMTAQEIKSLLNKKSNE